MNKKIRDNIVDAWDTDRQARSDREYLNAVRETFEDNDSCLGVLVAGLAWVLLTGSLLAAFAFGNL